jgi:uncharacterized protein (DUF58 family)
MCYAGASQNNGAAYLLCFLLTGLAIVSTAHTWANVSGLKLSTGPIPATFAGEELLVPVMVTARKGRTHFGICLGAPGANPTAPAIIGSDSPVRLEVRVPTRKRGRFQSVRLKVTSDYPLGFATALQRVALAQEYYVYPTPRGDMPLPRTLAPTRHPREGTRHEGDDFGGVRMWQQGESQRHIDWKAAARNDVLQIKQWTGEMDEIMRFDWSMLGALDPEGRLSQLCKWIVIAERGYETYELRLPGKTISAARGDKHYHECLRALALFEISAGAPA